MTEIVQRSAGREHIEQVALPSMAAFQRGQSIEHGAIGCLLQIQIQSGVDPQTFLMHLLAAKLTFQFAAHVFHEPGSDAVRRRLNMQTERRGLGRVGLRIGDHSVFQHGVDDHVAAAEGAIGIRDGRIGHRALGQSGQQRRFRQRQITRVFAEVVFRSSLKSINALAQIDLVGVQGKNLLLGERPLDLNGEKDLLQLAAEGLLAGEKEISRQLHGQGGSALGAAIRGQIVIRRAQHAEDVDSPMALKVLIFDRYDGLAQHWEESLHRGPRCAAPGRRSQRRDRGRRAGRWR